MTRPYALNSKLFEITSIYKTKKVISVFIKGRKGSLSVPREDFESFLERTDRLCFETEITVDHEGNPTGGDPATMDLEAYWDADNDLHRSDLYDFIVVNMDCDLKKSIDRITQPNAHVQPLMASILNSFNKAV